MLVAFESGQPVAYVCQNYPVNLNDTLQVSCWTWAFDGKFYQKLTEFRILWPSDNNDTVAIKDLQIFPLQYAGGGLEDELRTRGEIFWKCRFRKFVSYDVPPNGTELQAVRL